MIELEWETRHGDVVQVYRSGLPRRWRYRVRARNGKVVEQGSEGYTRPEAARTAAERHHPHADVTR